MRTANAVAIAGGAVSVALIDLGSMINDPNGLHGGQEETKIRFASALKAFTMLRYSAIGLSADDLKIGTGDALMSFLNHLPNGDDAPKVVAAQPLPLWRAGPPAVCPCARRHAP